MIFSLYPWRSKLAIQSIKTQTYLRITNPDYKMQEYLKYERNKNGRIFFAKFRTGSHWLQIHVGRFIGMERENRICQQCNLHEVEDEEHSLLRCTRYKDIRARYRNIFPCMSLEALFNKKQSELMRFVEECHEAHGAS